MNGVRARDEVRVPISRRVLAEKAGMSYRTVRRRIDVLKDFGFVKTGKNGGKREDSGFIALQTLVVDGGTGEVLLDAKGLLTLCPHGKREGVEETTEVLVPPSYRGDRVLTTNDAPGLVVSLRNGPGRLGKTSGNVLDKIVPLLSSSEEPLRPREITPALGLDPKNRSHASSVSRYLRKLCEKGIVEKENGRYRLRPEGERVIEEALRESEEGLKRQSEDHRRDRARHNYTLALWKSEKDGKELGDVPVPEEIGKFERVTILERERKKAAERALTRDMVSGNIEKKGVRR